MYIAESEVIRIHVDYKDFQIQEYSFFCHVNLSQLIEKPELLRLI